MRSAKHPWPLNLNPLDNGYLTRLHLIHVWNCRWDREDCFLFEGVMCVSPEMIACGQKLGLLKPPPEATILRSRRKSYMVDSTCSG
jgi:hypothetical protein